MYIAPYNQRQETLNPEHSTFLDPKPLECGSRWTGQVAREAKRLGLDAPCRLCFRVEGLGSGVLDLQGLGPTCTSKLCKIIALNP